MNKFQNIDHAFSFYRVFVLDMGALRIECAFSTDYVGEVLILLLIPIFGILMLLTYYCLAYFFYKDKQALGNQVVTAIILMIGFLHLPMSDVGFNVYNWYCLIILTKLILTWYLVPRIRFDIITSYTLKLFAIQNLISRQSFLDL